MAVMGRPIGTGRAVSVVPVASCTTQPTTASVGPYSLTIRASGKTRRQRAAISGCISSPPTTNVRTEPGSAPSPSSAQTRSRWAGVILTMEKSRSPERSSGSSSRAPPPGSMVTLRPPSSGSRKLGTARSKAKEPNIGAPSRPPMP